MYERFTDRARKVMQLANQEALQIGDLEITTGHMLIGLIKEGYGIAANVLKSLGFDLGNVRADIYGDTKPCEYYVTKKLPHTPRAKDAIAFAVEEAQSQKCDYVGTEHMLLGLLRVDGGEVADLLAKRGISKQTVRAAVFDMFGIPDPLKPATEKTYRVRDIATVYAVQWRGPQDDEALEAFFANHKKRYDSLQYVGLRNESRDSKQRKYMLCPASEYNIDDEYYYSKLAIYPGCWIVANGDLCVMSNDEFQRIYVEATT